MTPLAPSSGTASAPTSTPVPFATSTTQNLNTTTVGGDSITSNPSTHSTGPVIDPALVGVTAMPSMSGTPRLDSSAFNPARSLPQPLSTAARLGSGVVEEEVEGDDEMLPAMADDDYSAQLSWQSQSKDNLKCVSELCLSYFRIY
jgi:transcription initiation factor TFIID subunit 11